MAGATASAVAESAERAVLEGRLPPGAVLPPVRRLAAALGLSPATVAAAYRTLRLRGLVAGEGRRGTRVARRPPLPVRAPSAPTPGVRDLAQGNPDPEWLPDLGPAWRRLPARAGLYGQQTLLPALREAAIRQLEEDGIPATSLAVVGGALDGVERALQSQLRPGDRVAVEDPGYTGVLDLVAALGLVARPMDLDDFGVLPASLASALEAGVRAVVVTPRAQNPTGAAFDERRARALRALLDRHPDVLLVEDDHAGPVADAPALTLAHPRKARWAVVRSVSKSLGPDLRLAVLAGDPGTVARVEGRQAVGAGWVSHLLQGVVASLWSDPATTRRLREAARAYSRRRRALLEALARQGVAAQGRSGLNVWVPVREEAATLAAMAAAGWGLRAGEPYRIQSPPAVRITVSTLAPKDAARVAESLARAPAGRGRTPAA
ncbi:MAG TPA: aminotransferase class I/II-fold pyridoxal phosphate-dependent enzyme [Vicinamibacteria bacterium]|nr:aminotransferase class I/II-fold pyridoxal phosphate-dependent enzyme [Vicinamibacteria bacterium]